MFKKRMRSAVVIFVSIVLLAVLFVIYHWVSALRSDRGTCEIYVHLGDVGMLEGLEMNVAWEKSYQTDYNLTVENGKIKTGLDDMQIYSTEQMMYRYESGGLFESDFAVKRTEGIHEVKMSEFTVDMVLKGSNREFFEEYWFDSYRIKDYITLNEEDRFLYYYKDTEWESFEASVNFLLENEPSREHVCYLDGEYYLFLWEEPLCEYRCKYTKYGEPQNASSSMPEQYWGYSDICKNVPDEAYVSALMAHGEQEISFQVNKGIYRLVDNSTLVSVENDKAELVFQMNHDKGAELVFRMNDYLEDFTFLWMLTKEEEKELCIIGQRENRLVELRYNVEKKTVTEHVIWDAGEKLTEWIEAMKDIVLADITADDEKTYLSYFAGTGESERICVLAFENGSKIFEGEIPFHIKTSDDLKDFSLGTNKMFRRRGVIYYTTKPEVTNISIQKK